MVSLATINENLPVRKTPGGGAGDALPSLRRAAVPARGQSLRGLTADTLRRNGIKTAWRVLKSVGAPARNRPLLSEHPDVSAARLAAALRVDEGLVRARMYPLIGKGERSFFGLPVPLTGIETRERRFAPAFFKHDRHHLAAWELRLLPFCPVSWDILVSRCPCRPGKVTTQGWTRTGSHPDQCDECGRPLSRITTGSVPDALRQKLELISRLVTDKTHGRDDWRECLPANLTDANTADLFRVLHMLADNIRVPARTEHDCGQDVWTDASIDRLVAACTILTQWPYAIERAEFDLAEDSALLVKLQKDYCALGVVREGKGLGAGKRAGFQQRPRMNSGAAIGIREATALARLSVETLEAIWSAGLVTRYVRPHGGRVLPAFDVSELQTIAAKWRERLELGAVAYRLGIPRYGMEQLCDQGTVPVSAISAGGFEPAFLQKDVAEFEEELADAADDRMTDGVSINQAMRKVWGRTKPWSELVSAMLGGKVKFGVLKGKDPIFDRVVLGVDVDIRTLPRFINDDGDRKFASKRLCQTDALEILNCAASSLSILSHLESKGRNPRFFDRSSILDLATKIVATAEVAEHLGVHPARVARIMRSANIHEVVRGGWPRKRTMRFVVRVNEIQASQTTLPFASSDDGSSPS